jgi:antitoxin MazE
LPASPAAAAGEANVSDTRIEYSDLRIPTSVDIGHQTEYTLCISLEVDMKTKVVKWGNSLGLRIPKSFAEEVKVTEGSTVDLSMEDGRLVIRLATQLEYSLEELLGGITETNLHSEVESGEPVGGEEW